MSWMPFIGVELEEDVGHNFVDSSMGTTIRRKPPSNNKYPTTSGTTDIGYHIITVDNNNKNTGGGGGGGGGGDHDHLEAVDWYINNLLRGRTNKLQDMMKKEEQPRRKLIGIIGQDDSSDMQAQYLRGLAEQKQQTSSNDLNMTSWTATSFGSLSLVGAALIAYHNKRKMFGNRSHHNHQYESDP